jgi:hypothetical protein
MASVDEAHAPRTSTRGEREARLGGRLPERQHVAPRARDGEIASPRARAREAPAVSMPPLEVPIARPMRLFRHTGRHGEALVECRRQEDGGAIAPVLRNARDACRYGPKKAGTFEHRIRAYRDPGALSHLAHSEGVVPRAERRNGTDGNHVSAAHRPPSTIAAHRSGASPSTSAPSPRPAAMRRAPPPRCKSRRPVVARSAATSKKQR